jgi:hypothetical protein
VRPAVEAEKLGIPSVVVTLTGFTKVAHQAAKAMGVPDLRIAEYPGAVGVHPQELVRKNVEAVLFDRIVEGLTGTTSSEGEASAAPSRSPDEIVFRGDDDAVQEFFRQQKWTDGLPIIPPTRERVEAFLKHTPHKPDETIAILPQANLAGTPRNVAVNAVMAGCRPEHMPILIATVEAIGDERYNLNNIGTTWGVVPYLLVNGPIVKELGLEYAGQLISKGPNPALGRALGLIIKNVAGYQPGENYMGTFGYPLCFALAENEAENPWQPYHVEQGFEASVSTVTAGASVTWGWPPSPYETADKTAAQSALEFLRVDITKRACMPRLAERGINGFRNMVTLLLAPPVAKTLAAAGYSKHDIKDYLYENARAPVGEIGWGLTYGHPEAFTVEDYVKLGIYPEEYMVEPDELVRVLPSPDVLHIVVCGDPDRNRIMTLWSGYVQPVTKQIDLPDRSP